MPERKRIKMVLEINLDPVPGVFHTKEDARDIVDRILKNQLGHYDPSVNFQFD